MNSETYNNFYHVDISNQIDNKWKKDSVLGIVKDSEKYSIKIKGRDKEIIKRRFIWDNSSDSNKKHNKRVVALVYSYLLYKAIRDFPKAKPLLLCRDVRPERYIIYYWQKICRFFKDNQAHNREIKFRKRTDRRQEKLPKSLAGKYVRKVYQEKLPATKNIIKEDLDELINLISKLL